jgi:hypothetical protein
MNFPAVQSPAGSTCEVSTQTDHHVSRDKLAAERDDCVMRGLDLWKANPHCGRRILSPMASVIGLGLGNSKCGRWAIEAIVEHPLAYASGYQLFHLAYASGYQLFHLAYASGYQLFHLAYASGYDCFPRSRGGF